MRTASVNIVMTYPVHWTEYQVLRDFVQNFYDAVGFIDWRSRFRYSYEDSVLTMWVEDLSFNYEWLMYIGASTKTARADEFAGFFGEGFKIASLCAFRDFGWNIQMMSDDWRLEVTEISEFIDNVPVSMLAYNISSGINTTETKLVLKHISADEYQLFTAVLDSFFCNDNPVMGELLWQGKEGAVFLRSRNSINEALPITDEFGRKGAVFCGYQLLGTNPFDLVICLHRYRKEDRERRGLYSFEVIDVFEKICRYVDAKCAMTMLEKMRRYWNSYPQKKIDIHSWSRTVDMLIRKVSQSSEIRAAFNAKYENILCLRKIYSIGERNQRWQARAWLEQQDKKYILAKGTFQLLGYPLIEEECEKNGGFVIDDNPDPLQERCFKVLEEVCNSIFRDFFILETFPERKIINNSRASYHGMAIVYRKKRKIINMKGLRVKSDIGEIYLKAEIFKSGGYYDALSTYIHEMCHMFGGDASASFSLALTFATELLLENHEKALNGKRKWDCLFERT